MAMSATRGGAVAIPARATPWWLPTRPRASAGMAASAWRSACRGRRFSSRRATPASRPRLSRSSSFRSRSGCASERRPPPGASGRGAHARDPFVHQLLEQREWHATILENHRVEILQVESRSERRARLRAQREDLELTHLVGARLSGIGHVALDLGGDLAPRQPGGVDHVVDRLLARPVLGMEPRVDHQACGPQQLELETAEITPRIVL